jgi:hypothetical protein
LIPTPGFARQPHFESLARRSCIGMQIKSPPTERANPAPLPRKGGIAKQCGLDREHVKARQIASAITSLQDKHLEIVGFLLHTDIVRISGWASNAKIESMTVD